MSIKITTNQNTVTVADADKSITIINNREPNRIEVVQPESSVIYVATPGPQGPGGGGGVVGSFVTSSWTGSNDSQFAGTSSFATTASYALNTPIIDTSSLVGTGSFNSFTSSIQTQVNNLTAATSSYVLTSVTQSMLQPYVLTSATSSMIVSGALTASYYQETDPIFTAVSGTFVLTSSFNSFTSSINTFTASYNTGSFSGSLNGTSSWAVNALTASSVTVTLSSNADERVPIILASTGSISGTKLVYVDSGFEYNTSTNALYVPSNGAYIIGNTSIQSSVATFGSSGNQNHVVRITGSLNVSKSVSVNGAITAGFGPSTVGFVGTASWAESASYSLSSSFATSASYARSSSYANFAETASYANQSSDIILQVLNQTGANIAKGIVVRITGSNNASDTPRIGIADWTNDNLSANTIGLTTTAIANGELGYVLTEGLFLGYDTDIWTSGQLVFLGANGTITGSAPQAPLHAVRLGQVVRSQQNQGSIYIRIDNGYEIDELHDVKITNVSIGDLLTRSGSVWINTKQLSSSYGITGSLSFQNGGITGSLYGTSSWARNAITASFLPVNTYQITASWAQSASNALTASYINTLYSSNFTASFGASTTWTINHNLNTRYVIVQTFDSNHNQMLPKEITLTNANTATATFSQAESGYAVVTVGGALLTGGTPGGSTGQVQYNNNGAFDGNSNFNFDGTYTELKGAGGYIALSTAISDYYTYTDQLNRRFLNTNYVTDFVGNEKFAGDILKGTVSATAYDLVFLQTTDTWLPVSQSDNAKATQMLGIYDSGTNILLEGYVVVGENGVASNVPLIAGTLTPGAPVYIKESATSAPFLDTTVPTSGIVRLLGHLIRNEGSGYWFMKFRPDHTWVKI